MKYLGKIENDKDIATKEYVDNSKEVYVGEGDLPEGYVLQVDPSGTPDGIISYYAGYGISIVDGVISINLVDAEGVAY